MINQELGVSYFPKWVTDISITPSDIAWLEPTNRFDPRHQRMIKGRPSQGYGVADFSYAGKTIRPLPWECNDKITELKKRLEKFLGVEFYFCLCGLYEDHTVGIPMHHDEIEHDDDVIVSLSFGATRLFEMKETYDTAPLKRYILEEGDLVVMTGKNQRIAQHAVPEQETPAGPRVNLTFRTKRSFS